MNKSNRLTWHYHYTPHAYAHTYTYTQIRTHTRTHALSHTHKHTNTHNHTHTRNHAPEAMPAMEVGRMPMAFPGTGLGTNNSAMGGVELASKAGSLPSWPWPPMPHVSTLPPRVRMAQWRAPATILMACSGTSGV